MLQDHFLSHTPVSRGEALEWGRRTYVMGIVNVTPDSFSGDGMGTDVAATAELALRFEEEGADFIDVGAESTRPGSSAVGIEQELRRLMPAIEAIQKRLSIPISVDTYKSEVARRALEAGATIINDVWGLKADPGMAAVVAEHGAPIILMHNQKTTKYRDLMRDVKASLSRSIAAASQAGVSERQIVIDPGIGFGKTADHNLEVLKNLEEFQSLGHPVLVGTSRKSTIGRVLDLPIDKRVEGTAATVTLSIAGGADIVRVHDVKEMVRVCRMSDAVVRGWRPTHWSS